MNEGRVNGDRQRLPRSVLLILCVSLSAIAAPSVRARSAASPAGGGGLGDWPMFHSAPSRSGVNGTESRINVVTASTLGPKWTFATGGPIYSSPAVSGGVVYFGSDDKKVYAVNANTGTLKWSYATGGLARSPPAVVGDVVYVGSDDNKVYALNASTGTKIWSYTAGGGIELSSPLVALGKVFVGSLDGNVYALDSATGTLAWSANTWAARGSFAISGSTVYVGSDKSTLWAFDANTGVQKWATTVGGRIRNTPSLSGSVAYVGADDGRVYAFNASTGVLKWETPVLGGCAIIRSSPAIYRGKIYVVTGETCPMDGHLYVFDANTGTQICNHELADYATSSVAIANGVALVGSFSHQLIAFDASNCNQLWDSGFTQMQAGIPSSPAISNGVVYVGSLDDSLYSFTPGGTPLSSFINIDDNLYDPSEVIGHDIGTGAQWTNNGANSHNVTDNSGMGLYASGTIASGGTYTFVFVGAGVYKYHCTIHPSMTGTIKAPMILIPTTGSITTVFTIQWATVPPPAGFVYDVQVRRPGSRDFVDWMMGTVLPSATFVADAGKGNYDFKAHLKKSSNGASADYSPFKTITVS